MKDDLSISNKTRTLEIAAVVFTALGKFVFMDYLKWRFAFITTAIILWTAYVIYRSHRKKGITRYWGFRTDNFSSVAKKILPYGIAALLGFIGIGYYQHSINVTWHIIPILFLYPVWGIIQQYLLIALTVGNLQDYHPKKLPSAFIILLSAVLFSLVHYPFAWLMIATFILALFYGWLYLKERNIYVLGIFHGWLGALFFYTVLNRDPFTETFGKLIEFFR